MEMLEYQAAAAIVTTAATAWDHVSRHGSRAVAAGAGSARTAIPAGAVATSGVAESIGGSWTLMVGATWGEGGGSNSGADNSPRAPGWTGRLVGLHLASGRGFDPLRPRHELTAAVGT